MAKKTHYFLVSGEVMYTHPSIPDAIGTIRLNTMLQTEAKIIRHLELGKAQQMLQLHFHNRMQDGEYNVQDVFLYAVSYMGLMTEEEFATKPVGEQAKPFAPTPIAKELN